MQNDEIPVFLINGFLDAGKTKFLTFTINEDYFRTEGKTLLIVCEEGENEYPDKLLKDTRTIKVVVNDISEITTDKLKAMEAAYDPERVIIEWNGMWPQQDFRIPDGWMLNQQVTIIDTSTFDLYVKNMKPILGQMLRYSELVLCNRADNIPEETLGNYYTQLRAMTQNAEIIFEGKDGEIRGDFNIELPYDVNEDFIKLDDKDFGYFYIDIMDRPERYEGKTVEYTGEVLRPAELGKGCFVVGRMVMTCCEADVRFLGPIVYYDGAEAYNNKDWIKITAKIRAMENKQYGGVGPVLFAEKVVRTSPINGFVGF